MDSTTSDARKNKKKSNSGSSPKTKLTSRNAARERSRVRSLRNAFQTLQDTLPAIPRHTKLSKLDVLVLAATYIQHLSHALNPTPDSAHCTATQLHPVRKWPMRSRLYAGVCANLTECQIISDSSSPPLDDMRDIDVTNELMQWDPDLDPMNYF
uniref:BHLH domain-containing protein n=1 Tax=Strigamia maritima TaxID=126957 RepID=T1J080_STRMM